jgi:uncharacterized protein
MSMVSGKLGLFGHPMRMEQPKSSAVPVRKDRLWYDYRMNKHDIIARLKENEAALRAQGVAHAALFGSVARGDQRPDSDIDIMIELDPAARVTMFDYVDIKEYIEGLFQGPVDVVNRDGLEPFVRPRAAADAIYAF